MKAVLLEGDAVNHNDLSWEPLTKLIDTKIYANTTEQDKYEHIGDADVLFVNKIKMDEEVFERCPNIRYIGVCATGYNVIDIEAAKRHNVTVTNVPAYSTDSVAQLTWGLILESVCHISRHNESVHNGDWIKSEIFCYWLAPVTELTGKTIGVVGYGNIGRRVCEIAKAFNMNVLVNTSHPEKYTDDKVLFTDIDTLFEKADIVSLHCPLTADTEKIINKSNINKMKDGVIIINVSRGGLVDEADLASALKSGKVAAAGVDVVSVEPMKEDNPLLDAPNMTFTPHMGWASVDARKRLVDIVANNFKAFTEGRKENVVS
ncbi:MAG: D-2-hydroxyacid dehydrogenase [Lachnospiraceae bacterium]|nr:D-2-hydroxyacid dehydrogenase [Lachnospiraceae bacterium]MBQ9608013.1 D-2-hydroxyacid dehydrogenase [Lachnospiraceae bacterium]